jgi:hypothetical protein
MKLASKLSLALLVALVILSSSLAFAHGRGGGGVRVGIGIGFPGCYGGYCGYPHYPYYAYPYPYYAPAPVYVVPGPTYVQSPPVYVQQPVVQQAPVQQNNYQPAAAPQTFQAPPANTAANQPTTANNSVQREWVPGHWVTKPISAAGNSAPAATQSNSSTPPPLPRPTVQ